MLLTVKLLSLLLEHLIADAHVFFISFIVKFTITIRTPIQIHFILLHKCISAESTGSLLLKGGDHLLINLVLVRRHCRRAIASAIVFLLLLISIALVATSWIVALFAVVVLVIVVARLIVAATTTTIVTVGVAVPSLISNGTARSISLLWHVFLLFILIATVI